MILALSDDYGRDFFVKSKDARWYEALFIRLYSVFTLHKLFNSIALLKKDDNFIMRNKKPLSGKLHVASSENLDFRLMKALQKTIGVTINDIVTTALAKAMKQIFEENNDHSKSFNLFIPANIRFKFYPTAAKVKLENMFAVMPLVVPMVKDMTSSYATIQKVTKHLKNSLS